MQLTTQVIGTEFNTTTARVKRPIWRRGILLLMCLPFAGCTGLGYELGMSNGNGYKISKTKKAYWHPTSAIEYKSHELLLEEYRAKLDNRFASAAEIANAPTMVPPGGRVIVHINRSTIGAANTEHFVYVLARGGEEIDRVQGRYDVPELPTRAGGDWWNIDIVNIQHDFEDELAFYVIDELTGGRDEFIIRKPAGK